MVPGEIAHSYLMSAYEKLFVLMASLMPLAVFNFKVGLGWTADRALLILLMLLFPYYLYKRRMGLGVSFALVFIGVFVLLSGLFLMGEPRKSMTFVPSLIQAYAVFGIGSAVFKNNLNAIRMAKIIFISWGIILLIFSVYMLYFYYVIGTNYVPFPFGGEYSDPRHRMKMMHGRRLFLPFASAPFIGVVAGFMSLWGFIFYVKLRQIWLVVFAILMLAITILALSRGPVLSFCLAFLFFFILGLYNNVIKPNKQLLGMIVMFVIVVSGIVFYQQLQMDTIGKASINRLAIDVGELSESKHMELRLNALELFSNGNFAQLFFGQGLGAYGEAGFGAYSFSSYLTLLAEAGIIGLLVFIATVCIPLFWFRRFSSRDKNARFWALSIFSLALFIAFTHLFYELKTLQCLWLQTSFVFGLSQSRVSILSLNRL